MNLIRNHLLLFCLVSSSTLFAKILVDECKPPQNYANKKQQDAIDITAESIVFITHSSRLFDPLGLTKNSMNHLVSESKNNSFPVYYLHDSWNPYNPFSSYLYDDCEPDAYIQSDIGFHFLNLKNVRSIYVAGGYYEMCERNTITSAIDNWVAIDSHSSTPMTFHIYQITDAVFSIGENIRSADDYNDQFREIFYDDLKVRHPNSSMQLSKILELIPDDAIVDFLKRDLPGNIPKDWNLKIHARSKEFKIHDRGKDKNSLVIHFITSEDL